MSSTLDPITLEVLREQLSGEYEVICATSGPDALEAARNRQPSLILLDIEMPGMTGLETLRALKQVAPALPVVLFSAAADEIHKDAMTSGAFACVPKSGWLRSC